MSQEVFLSRSYWLAIGETCLFEGQEYQDGEEWKPTPCSKCICNNGASECYAAECHPVVCKKDENLIIYPGKCCPQCVTNSCLVSKKEYKGQNKVKRAGQCCEECVSSKGNCLYEGSIRYHGEMWNGTGCEFCMCERGQVMCQKAECAKVECIWGEELMYLPGKCCPECLSMSSFCVYKEQSKEGPQSDLRGEKHLANFERWREGLCRECECRDSQALCFQRSCPSCPVGTLAVAVEGECCPQCRPVQCHSDCLTCSQSPDHCESCRDSRLLLQNGLCVQACEPGFHENGRVCKACKETCAACKNEFECTLCGKGRLMKYGKCVTACGDGFYQNQRHCAACHESCSSCRGPAERDCLSCEDPSHVLKAGTCVASCGQGFYINSGNCYACHSSCAACAGPSATQCSLCPGSLVLHQGQCIPSCGEGFYPQHGVCKACHQTCRSCVGPKHSDCTQCLKPEEVLHSHRKENGIPHGVCVSECKPQLYLNTDNICKEVLRTAQPVLPQRSSMKERVYSSAQMDCIVRTTLVTAPYVLTNEALLVSKGEAGTISSLLLKIEDDDNLQDILVMVLDPPKHGRLVRLHGDVAVQQFRPDDLERGQLQYVHDGTDSQQDLVLLQMNDGHSFQNILFQIKVNQKNDKGPHLLSNSLALVPEGGMLQITSKYLKAEEQGSSDSEIIYTITSSKENLKFGDVILLVPMPADSPADGWQRLPDGRAATATTSFTQQDVNEGIVWYRHSGSGAPSDTFQFQSNHDGNINDETGLVDDIVLLFLSGAIEHQDRPYTSVQFFTQAEINQGQILYRPPMAPSHLRELYLYSFTVSDGEHTTPEMEFTIHLLANHQQPPVFQISDPSIEVSQGGRVPVGDTFTFDDIAQNTLQYLHDGETTEEDSMEFSVTDGVTTATTQVRVLVSVTGNGGPKLASGSLLSIEVSEKSTTVIGRSHIAYVDNNSPDDKIRIQLISLPMYGMLTMTESSQINEELSEFSSFTMEDINRQRISYTTSFETGSQPVTDIFHFVVYDADNNHLDNQMCTITIKSVQQQPPVATVSSGITVEEGGRVLLSSRNILATDPDTSKKDLLIRLITPPQYGYIENSNRDGKSGGAVTVTPDVVFSLEDIISNNIYYVQSVHQTVEHLRDSFSFYITDGSSQTEAFTIDIDIRSKNDEPPKMSVSSVQVEEASGVVIRNTSLTLLDLDTPDNELVFIVTKKPDYGKLRRRQFYSEPLENGRVLSQGSSFTYQDVLDELIVYTPDSLSVHNDEFRFSVTDGLYTENGRMEFTMNVQKSETPRLAVNRGLQLAAGSVAKITDQHLKATDIDSDELKVKYTMTKDPTVGRLQLSKNGNLVQISIKGPVKSFTQADINKGFVEYRHEKGESGGSFAFEFDLTDLEGNKLIDQSFYISILEDRLPPSVIVNKGLVLDENSVKKITTLQLSATDQDSEPGDLVYSITKQTQLGRLEHAASPGSRISTFTQADLASRSIQYVHTSEEEKHSDDFTFVVSDGANEVAQTFYITIRPVDDSLPLVQNPGMRVQEGVRKTITEFELKATDADTEAESVTFTIVQVPRHGTIERTNNGQHYRQTNSFTMDDIYQNRVSYNHDGSNSLKDRFTFTVSDGTNQFFMVEEGQKEIVTAAPQRFKIDILPVDDGTPRIVTNLGLQWLEYMEGKATNLITKKELLTMDPDTEDKQLVYEITATPKHGYLETKLKPGAPITTFTQADINLGLIRYVLNEERIQETMDTFKFLVKDSKPNVVSDNVFHIQWSLISFQYTSFNVSEKAGTVSVAVKRSGNLNQYAIVLCRTEQGTATSTSSIGSKPGQQDYVEYAGQVQFDEREDTKACTIVINDDQVFENIESFNVELSMPAYALLGKITRAKVNINDTEDEPTLQFDKKAYHVNESAGFFFAPIERKGDTSSTVSALCYTVSKSAQGSSLHALESGSDFKSRGMSSENRVVFGPGVSMSTCDVKLIDDSEYEGEEEFEIVLADASDNARLGGVANAKVMIDGPNDAATVFLGNASFTFSEDAGTIEIPVLRHGSDLSTVTSVWCATRPSDPASATPGVDYIPSSKKVEFRPGKTEEVCSLTILDDTQNPTIEGTESFVVFLSSAQGAELTKPFQATVVITDTFQDGTIEIPVLRHGSDLSTVTSVWCATRPSDPASATPGVDYIPSSKKVEFRPGKTEEVCSLTILDDTQNPTIEGTESFVVFLSSAQGAELTKPFQATVVITDTFQDEEQFQVYLSNPLGNHWSGARVGKNEVAIVTITNDEDAPTIEFEEPTYQVREPPGPDGIEIMNIKVIRKGDQNRTSKVRCSTRDGSAQSGVDYNPKSRVLKFSPGIDHILFNVEILSNEDREWHESFSLVLGPDDPVEAVLGEITTATVTILDQEAAGSLILPALPIVVSLSDYDHVQEVTKEGSKKTSSPGYPLVCVTPCDPHYPKHSVMKERCDEAGINQSSIRFSWEVAAPTDINGARSPFETVTDNTPYTSINHKVLDSVYFSRRFHVRCVAKAVDNTGHVGTPLRSSIVTIGTEGSICHTPVVAGTARGYQAQSFIATLKYLDVKHKEHPNRIHISVQIPHQDGMLPLISTMPLHNLNFLLSESIYRQQHICSNLVTLRDLEGISETGFLDDVFYDSISLGPGFDRPYQFNPSVREPKTIQLYKHLNLKSCIWTFDAYYDMTELIDVCGGSVTADFQVRDSAQSFLTVQVPLYVSYIYVTAPRGWASLEHHTEMEFSFFYDTVLWRTGIQTDSVLSARLQIIRIYIREDGRLVIEFKTHAKFRGQFVMEHHTLPGQKSHLMAPDHLGGIEFDLQLLWSAQSFDSPYQLWRATSSYSRKDYSGEYSVVIIPCTVQPTQPWIDPGDKPLTCTAHAPEKFLVPIAFQQTNRPVPVVYSLNTEFQLCNNEKIFMMDPATAEMSMTEMDYKGAFSMGQTLYGRVLWNPEQNLNSAYKLQLEKVYLCTGKDGYVPFFDPTGTLYNEGPQYGCIQPNKHLKHRFLILDRNQPEVCDRYFHDVPFDANFASDLTDLHSMTEMPGVDGFTMKVDALYKVEAGHQWYLQVIYVIGPESISGPRIQRSLTYQLKRSRRDLVDKSGQLTLDESLIYDNEGDQVKNGTNMKPLSLEVEAAASASQTGSSIGGAVAAVTVLLLIFLASCFLFKKCRRQGKKKMPTKNLAEEYPLNTKVEVCLRNVDRLEKNLNSKHCTARNVNILNKNEACKVKGVKVKQVNLEVKVHNNLHDGTEV
ncbi:UNVERIFIED_CONTAM: hypothetical protein FKN15_006840 [Acipenser sinensis]